MPICMVRIILYARALVKTAHLVLPALALLGGNSILYVTEARAGHTVRMSNFRLS